MIECWLSLLLCSSATKHGIYCCQKYQKHTQGRRIQGRDRRLILEFTLNTYLYCYHSPGVVSSQCEVVTVSPDTTADPVYDIAIWDTETEDAGAAGDVVNWLEETGGQVGCRKLNILNYQHSQYRYSLNKAPASALYFHIKESIN